MKKIYALLFCLCLFQGSYGQSLPYKVAVVYAVPKDVTFNQEVLDSIKVITAEMQGWYQLATGGKTFERLYADTVITYRALQNRQFYVDNGNWWGSLLYELQTNSSVPVWKPGYLTVVWAHGAGWWAGGTQACGKDCGTALVGVELLAKFNNPAYSGGNCPSGNGVFSWPCTPQGALFHEFGHALGLLHPVDIPATKEVAGHSIMQTHWNYPNWAPPQESPWGLLTIERQQLAQNPFIKANVNLRQIVNQADVVNLPVTGPVPDAAFSYTRTGNQFSFANQSSGATSYYWTFGDGTVSNAANPVHEFQGPGPYKVTLRASNEEQMMDTASVTLSTQPGQGQQVLSFTLINANTEQPIKVISPGEVLNLATLPTRNLNIRADTDPGTVGSVNFALTGPYRRHKWDNLAPYALYGDKGGNYYKWIPLPGTYSLTATPYTKKNAGGKAGTPLAITFTVVDKLPLPQLASFTLINTSSEQPIRLLTEGETLYLSDLPKKLNIRADTAPARVGSVTFKLSGRENRTYTDNAAPYALFGDVKGDYEKWFPTPGAYTLQATPYTQADGKGSAGVSLIIQFRVVAGPAARLTAGQEARQAEVAGQARLYPNPTSDGRLWVQLPGQAQGPVRYTLLTALGSTLAEGSQHPEEATGLLELDFSGQLPAAGVYFLRLEGARGRQVFRILRR